MAGIRLPFMTRPYNSEEPLPTPTDTSYAGGPRSRSSSTSSLASISSRTNYDGACHRESPQQWAETLHAADNEWQPTFVDSHRPSLSAQPIVHNDSSSYLASLDPSFNPFAGTYTQAEAEVAAEAKVEMRKLRPSPPPPAPPLSPSSSQRRLRFDFHDGGSSADDELEYEDLELDEIQFGNAHSDAFVGHRRPSQILDQEDYSSSRDRVSDSHSRWTMDTLNESIRSSTPSGRYDLYGGKTKRELFAKYNGESPLGPSLGNEPKDHDLDRSIDDREEEERDRATEPAARDVEAQRPRAASPKPSWRERIGIVLEAHFDAWSDERHMYVTLAMLLYMFSFVFLCFLGALGVLTPARRSHYRPEE